MYGESVLYVVYEEETSTPYERSIEGERVVPEQAGVTVSNYESFSLTVIESDCVHNYPPPATPPTGGPVMHKMHKSPLCKLCSPSRLPGQAHRQAGSQGKVGLVLLLMPLAPHTSGRRTQQPMRCAGQAGVLPRPYKFIQRWLIRNDSL